MRIAVQMDAIPQKFAEWSSSLALIEEAAKRGHEVFYFLPGTLNLDQGALSCTGKKISVDFSASNFLQESGLMRLDLPSMNVILIRQDPPFDMAYITMTHLLDHAGPDIWVMNRPSSIREHPEKLWVTHFPQLAPPTLITRDAEKLKEFLAQQKDIVLKPLYLFGGKNVKRLRQGESLDGVFDAVEKDRNLPVIAQKFLPEITQGDRRILLIDGDPIGCFDRKPRPGNQWTVGQEMAYEFAGELTARDLGICKILGPHLRDKGLFLAGIDVIGGYVTEINVTSPAGIRELERHNGIDAKAVFWDKVEAKLKQKAA